MKFIKTHIFTSNLYVLQNIVMENSYIPNINNLYVHNYNLSNSYILHKTDTYINMFNFEMWNKFSIINNVNLEVICKGVGKLILYGVKNSKTFGIQKKEISSVNVSARYPEIYIVNLNRNYELYYFAWEDCPQQPLEIIKASYVEGKKDNNMENCLNNRHKNYNSMTDYKNINIAIVIPTYCRNKEIAKIINIYMNACLKSNDFERHSHIFIVNNNIAEKNAFFIKSNEFITVINNSANTGGAGGFIRGTQEAIKIDKYSHILYMDDDAFPHEETWFRTLAFLRRMKPTYNEQIISGSMFTIEKPTWCHVIQEALNQRCGHVIISGQKDLSLFDDVIELINRTSTFTEYLESNYISSEGEKNTPQVLNTSPKRPYAAWWYCVIPSKIFIKCGYPLPVFFRGDDQEFGMRISRLTLSLNGICIWHRAFSSKRSILRTYLGVRNHAITNVLHFSCWRSNLLRQLFFKVAYELAANRYKECAARILAFRDFLHLDQVPHEGEFLLPRVKSFCEQFQSELQEPPSLDHFTTSQEPKRPISIIDAILIYLTFGGAFFPYFLRKRAVKGIHFRLIDIFFADWILKMDDDCIARKFNSISALRLVIYTITLLFRLITSRSSKLKKNIKKYENIDT